MLRTIIIAGLVAALSACQPTAADPAPQDTGPQYLNSPERANSNLPFSQAVKVGNVLYLSGMIGSRPGQGLTPGGIQPETRTILENMRTTLEQFDSGMDRVIKCTVMLADMAEWGAMNEVYREFFPQGRRPARSAFGTSGLAAGARVEIECMAHT